MRLVGFKLEFYGHGSLCAPPPVPEQEDSFLNHPKNDTVIGQLQLGTGFEQVVMLK